MRTKAGLLVGFGDHSHNSLQCRRFLRARECFARELKKRMLKLEKRGGNGGDNSTNINKQLSPRSKYACTAGYSHKYDIPLPPTLSSSMLAGPENMEGRSPCRENNDSLPIQIPRCDTPFGQFKEEKLMQLGYVFSAEKQNFVYHNDFGRRRVTYHVTITFRDKSRYDLIVEI